MFTNPTARFAVQNANGQGHFVTQRPTVGSTTPSPPRKPSVVSKPNSVENPKPRKPSSLRFGSATSRFYFDVQTLNQMFQKLQAGLTELNNFFLKEICAVKETLKKNTQSLLGKVQQLQTVVQKKIKDLDQEQEKIQFDVTSLADITSPLQSIEELLPDSLRVDRQTENTSAIMSEGVEEIAFFERVSYPVAFSKILKNVVSGPRYSSFTYDASAESANPSTTCTESEVFENNVYNIKTNDPEFSLHLNFCPYSTLNFRAFAMQENL